MSFDRLPDELVVRVFRCLLDERENYAQLRRTCRRFCFIINHQLVTAADDVQFPRLALRYCRVCEPIWRAANLDLVQCKHLFISEPASDCCLDSIKHLRHKLQQQQITELSFARYISGSGALNVFLDTLTSVGRLNILTFDSHCFRPLPDRPEPLPAAPPLAHLRLDLVERSNLQPSLLNVAARHLSIDSFNGDRRSHCWLQSYLERHGSFVETVACKLYCCYDHSKMRLCSMLERFDYNVCVVGGDHQTFQGFYDKLHGRAWCCDMLATKRDGRARGDACQATEVSQRHTLAGQSPAPAPFDRLPDELVVRIVRCFLDEPNGGHLKQLRATCKRFCSLINHKLLAIDEPQLPTVGRYVDDLCANCYDLWRLTKFKHVKCRHFVMRLPIMKCCLATVEQRAASLQTIVELTLLDEQLRYDPDSSACLSADDLNSVLGSLSSVRRLNIDEETTLTTTGDWKNRGRISMSGGRQVRVLFVKNIA
jgi:hypothetical protein